jgi:transcriptional regulator with XRE-family HTH domain
MSEFGKALTRYRTEAGLNQRELGAAIGLDSTQLNKIERGHRPPLGAKFMRPVVRALRLNQSEAENLVDLARLPRKVLDFMDEVVDGQGLGSVQTHQKTTTARDALAATGTFGAPSSLKDDQEQQLPTLESFEEQVRQIITSYHLPYAKRMIAQQMSLEAIRIICWGLKEAE